MKPEVKNIIIDICKKNDISKACLFGSAARGEETESSDIDILIKFSKPKSLIFLAGIERILSESVGQKVDLVTENSLSPYIRENVLKDMEIIYEA
ncbi:MAG: nucleotidyltransferase family protein [Desulfobacteraceae bacterium]